ncbi:MAG: hypothetical protein LBF95_05625 [Treponema sp.]|nr:hypothetical protein [Treponema sp.]
MMMCFRRPCRALGAAVWALFWPLVFGSCGAAISGVLERGGTGDFEVSAALTPAFAAKMGDFMSFSGAGDGSLSLINAAEIARSMAGAPGMGRVSFRNTGPAALEGPVTITRLGDFLAPSGRAGFIDFRENPGGGGRALITLDRENVPAMLSLISPDVVYYLNFIFAPIVTGERIDREEYLAQVALFHNPEVAEELAGSEIRVSVGFPGPLVSVRGGTFSGGTAEFVIPLVELLVLSQPLSYEAVWR